MKKPFVSIQKASSISGGLFLLALGLLAYFETWWPHIMLAIGFALAVRQILVKKFYDAILSIFIFGGIFVTVYYHLSWLPVIFVIAGLFVLFRAAQSEPETLEEEEEETQIEIEEETDDENKR
jgi:predicted membrane protein